MEPLTNNSVLIQLIQSCVNYQRGTAPVGKESFSTNNTNLYVKMARPFSAIDSGQSFLSFKKQGGIPTKELS